MRLEPLDLEMTAAGVPPGHEVRILDLLVERRPERAFRRMLREYSPDLLGFGGYSSQVRQVRRLARLAKQLKPGIRIAAGGIHATLAPQDFQRPELFDVVLRGDGAAGMNTLVTALASGRPVPESSSSLPVSSERFAEWAAEPPPVPDPACLLVRPRRDLVRSENYYFVCGGSPGEKLKTLFPSVASLRTSFGCPYLCSFCVVHHLAHGKYLPRTPEDVADEIAGLSQEYVYFVDDEMFIQPERARRIAEELLARKIRKKYVSWARSDTICNHPDVFRLWKQAGLETLYVGLESLDENRLLDYNKGVPPSVNRKAVETLRELGIGLHAALIVDPAFSTEDFMKLRRTAAELTPAEVTFTVLSPSPGTDLFAKTRESFICPDPYAFYDCMHTLLPTRLPLNLFYRHFSLLYLYAFRRNPWRMNRIHVPARDFLRMMWATLRCGWTLRHIYRDYDRTLW
ncbi:MAG: radical SAM protein [Kiritimatiellia bacterium]|nr:radical SAM protein [Kiritimatiellia bacterium]